MSIKLFCLIKGNLTEYAKNIKLKKVNIKINYNTTTIHESELRNGIQLRATDNIEKYWTETPQKEHIHVLVELSLCTSPVFKLSASEDIKEILSPFIISGPQDPLRESISELNDIPDGISNISTYLKFVGREEEVKQLMTNMENLYLLINQLKKYPEPMKEIEFPTAVGTAGKEKTTFARRAYENSKIYDKIVKPEVVLAVKECQKSGRNFRIACNHLSNAQIEGNRESSFGKILLYEALKYRLPDDIDSLKFDKIFGDKFNFEDILDLILFYIPCSNKKIKNPLIIINIDETNALFESSNSAWLKMVLRSLARTISKGYFLFVVLSGTHANALFNTVKSSSIKTEDISLPLLNSKHAEEVILELANRKVVNEKERINELSKYLKYAIKLLGVVGRFLEIMIFQMSVIGTSVSNNSTVFNNVFYQSGLRYFLQKCQYESKHCQKLLERTKMFISRKYQYYFEHFKSKINIELVPFLVAYTLFGWSVNREDTIGITNKRKIEDLENEELIFLDGSRRLKLPFLTLHEIYSHQNYNMLSPILILESLDNVILSNQNEKLTISVLAFRLWAIYQKSVADKVTDPCSCRLSQLVPIRKGQKNILLRFLPIFTVCSTEKQITEKNWRQFVEDNKQSTQCIAYYNLQNAKFVDSFLLSDPPILIQDKQLVTSRKKVIDSYSPIMLNKDLVKSEHDKYKNIGNHIFLFVTDFKKRDNETYKMNEVLITEEEKKDLFGDLLALKILHCIERR
ncbi:hypothetical protein Glove_9g43 [Diversispora epigaea]|uniref:Crinkler effector protein N-terminal domain-containing protein n=1 Tax=Diversispora epigaea TaxID=1348612 RepID=A0A397JSG3_9GLOM|nr:hypothetical protein Glove_9g43 [Diversispora epigaea]